MKKNSKRTGLVLLLIGALILLFQTGALGYGLINALLVFWPLFVIAVGVDIAFKDGRVKTFFWFISIAIILFFGIFGASFNFDRFNTIQFAETRTVDLDALNYRHYDDTRAKVGKVEVSSFSQKISIKSTDEAELIAENSIQFEVSDNREVTRYSCDTFSINQSEAGGVAPLYLSQDKLWLLDFSSANVNLAVDDKQLNIAKLKCSAAEVDINYYYDGAADTTLTIDAFRSNLTVYLPADAQFRVSVDSLYKRFNIDGEEIAQSSFQTAEYDEANNALLINIDALKSNVIVIYQGD